MTTLLMPSIGAEDRPLVTLIHNNVVTIAPLVTVYTAGRALPHTKKYIPCVSKSLKQKKIHIYANALTFFRLGYSLPYTLLYYK